MFKEGDKVYSILRGWGEVTDASSIEIDKYPIEVSYNGEIYYYMQSGKYLEKHLIPELYHTEPVITVPKRRVEHTGWIAVDNEIGGNDVRLTSAIIHEDNPERIMLEGRTYQQITYYTEE